LDVSEENERTWETRHWWKDNFKIDLKRIRNGDVDWVHVAQGRDQW
jgi:hypothetical protein